MPSPKFEQTYAKTRGIKTGPSNDEQLNLYAWAKIAKEDDIAKAPKPGMFDMTGKAKRKRWEEVINEGISPQEAEKRYIELGDQLIAKHLK